MPRLIERLRSIGELDFQAAPGGEDMLVAIELLREMNATGKRKLSEDAPTSFVAAKWEPFVRTGDGLYRRYYELCALSALCDHLSSGDIYVPSSRQYQDFEHYLLGQDAFAELRAAGEAPVVVETDFGRRMAVRSELLTDRLDEVNGLIEAGEWTPSRLPADGLPLNRAGCSHIPRSDLQPWVLHPRAPFPRNLFHIYLNWRSGAKGSNQGYQNFGGRRFYGFYPQPFASPFTDSSLTDILRVLPELPSFA